MAKAQIMRGSTQSIPLDVSDVFTDPTTRNLDGGTAFFTVKPVDQVDTDDTSDSAAVITKDVSITTHPTDGIVTFDLAPSDTESVTPGTYAWGAQTKESDGTITEFVFNPSKVTVVGDINRRTA
jgi:hypothetical protein